MVKVYAIWIKVDEKLPWIELEGAYQSKREAQKAAKELLKIIKVKIAKVGVEHKPMKAVAVVKR